MRRGLIWLCVCFQIASTADCAEVSLHLLPIPVQVAVRDGALAIDSSFPVTLTDFRDPLLERAVARLAVNLSAKTGLRLAGGGAPKSAVPGLRVRCAGPDPHFLTPSADESYRLEITPQGAELQAHAPTGIVRGLATFLQLVSPGKSGFRAPAVVIVDRPRFAWRGLMIDVSRHFMPAAVIRRQIDAMEAVKLNVLHLHLSDNQGFRVESRRYPKLHEMGSDGRYYTQEAVHDIVAYARDRGIRVVPEFDVPGHCTSWLVGYPELASKPGNHRPGFDWSKMHDALDPSNESTYNFLDGLFGEMSKLFPDRYFHIGGDEVTGVQWDENPAIQTFKKAQGLKDNHQLQAHFTRRVRQILEKHGRTMVGWDEVLQGELPRDVVVQSWRSSKMTARSAIAGHPTVVSAGYYLDWMMPSSFHYLIDPLDTDAHGITQDQLERVRGTPIGAFLSEDNVITAPIALDPEQADRIMGGEAAMWTELVSDESLDGRVWPRMAAMAERFWSARSCRDVDSLYQRLSSLDVELETLGLRHGANSRKMLHRMTSQDSTAIQTLAEILEPSKYYSRLFPRIQEAANAGLELTDLPINDFSDAVLPESLPARRFHQDVKRMLSVSARPNQPCRPW
jgi:hexosaminidase